MFKSYNRSRLCAKFASELFGLNGKTMARHYTTCWLLNPILHCFGYRLSVYLMSGDMRMTFGQAITLQDELTFDYSVVSIHKISSF